ncbi:DHHC palmitoyltransferase-domain-containing protein, partial [Pseudomassariella vexata]
VQKLAIPAVCLLIAFLGYGSQLLFASSPDLAPGPLTKTEKYAFNTLLLCLWWTYCKACSVDPGRYTFPPSPRAQKPIDPTNAKASASDDEEADEAEAQTEGEDKGTTHTKRKRHCRKCARPKPSRAHHCRTCARCIPKMDHHCPWTANCVSLQTFPHFLRFLAYTNVSLWMLLYLLSQRFLALWSNRHLPAYLGPSFLELVWLTVFAFVGAVMSFALGIMLGTTVKGWLFNTTMIEGWEIEKHEAVVERSERGEGWWRTGDDAGTGTLQSVIDPVEFPYDVGVFENMAQAMGTNNVLLWFFPFAGGPQVAPNRDGKGKGCGWEYEENGLNDREDMWPPTDPEKARNAKMWRSRKKEMEAEREHYEDGGRWATPEEQREAFRQRQEQDLRRWERTRNQVLGELEEVDDYDVVDEAYNHSTTRASFGGPIIVNEGRSGWVNEDGEQLADYGVDEDAEFDEPDVDALHEDQEDDDIPLGELLRRRKVLTKDG